MKTEYLKNEQRSLVLVDCEITADYIEPKIIFLPEMLTDKSIIVENEYNSYEIVTPPECLRRHRAYAGLNLWKFEIVKK